MSILFVVIRNLNPPSSNWEVEKLSCDLKIHGLEQELDTCPQIHSYSYVTDILFGVSQLFLEHIFF